MFVILNLCDLQDELKTIVETISWDYISDLLESIHKVVSTEDNTTVFLLYFHHSQFTDLQKRLVEVCKATSPEDINIMFSYIRSLKDSECNQLLDLAQVNVELNIGVCSFF